MMVLLYDSNEFLSPDLTCMQRVQMAKNYNASADMATPEQPVSRRYQVRWNSQYTWSLQGELIWQENRHTWYIALANCDSFNRIRSDLTFYRSYGTQCSTSSSPSTFVIASAAIGSAIAVLFIFLCGWAYVTQQRKDREKRLAQGMSPTGGSRQSVPAPSRTARQSAGVDEADEPDGRVNEMLERIQDTLEYKEQFGAEPSGMSYGPPPGPPPGRAALDDES